MFKKILMGVILFIYIILTFFHACTSLTKKQPHINHVKIMDKALRGLPNNFLPYENFIFLEKYVYYNEKLEKFCLADDISSDCEYKLYGEGSAIAYSNTKNNLKLLTVFHVCEEQTDEALSLIYLNEEKEWEYPVFTIKAHFYGKEYTARTIKTDSENDLCLMEIESEYAYKIKKIRVAKEKPKIGEDVYSLSAPLGIASDYTRLQFHGSWSGCDDKLTELPFCYYTIPAAPGSSGSGVFNDKGELVSILSIAMLGFSEISGGPRQNFIQSIIKN